MSGYTRKVLSYAADQRHVGVIRSPHGTGEVGLAGEEAGTRLAVRFTLRVAAERIENVRFQVFGCGYTIAACAAVADFSQGKTLAELNLLTPALVEQLLQGGLPSERRYCAELACQALQAAVSSVGAAGRMVRAEVGQEAAHGPRLNRDDALFLTLLEAADPALMPEDRELFAALLTLASREPWPLAAALGLEPAACDELLSCCFPDFNPSLPAADKAAENLNPPEVDQNVRALVLGHVPADRAGTKGKLATWLARIIVARAAHPGHLWIAMGFFERPQLTAAIRRHLPALAEANSKGMRWKRFLFKTVCERGGGMLCKSPDCRACSDYALCFAGTD